MHSARAYMQALHIIKSKSWTLAEVSVLLSHIQATGVSVLFIYIINVYVL